MQVTVKRTLSLALHTLVQNTMISAYWSIKAQSEKTTCTWDARWTYRRACWISCWTTAFWMWMRKSRSINWGCRLNDARSCCRFYDARRRSSMKYFWKRLQQLTSHMLPTYWDHKVRSGFYYVVTPLPAGVQSIAISMSVCLSVRSHISKCKLHEIFCRCYLWP